METPGPIGTQLTCTQCGGELHPDEGQIFLTCPYCGATVYVDRSRVVFHWSVAPTLDERQALAALYRWMSGSQTVKDLDKKARVEGQMFQYFPLWYFKMKDSRGEAELLRPAAATSVTELSQLKIPAGDLKPYDPVLDAQAVPPTVPLEAALEWLGLGGSPAAAKIPAGGQPGAGEPAAGPSPTGAGPKPVPGTPPNIASVFQLPAAERLPDIQLPGIHEIPAPAPASQELPGEPAQQTPREQSPAQMPPAAPASAGQSAAGKQPAQDSPKGAVVEEAAVVHVPLYFYKYTYAGKSYTAVVDAASGGALASVYPPKAEAPYQLIASVTAILYLCLATFPLIGAVSGNSSMGLLACGGLGMLAAPFLFAWAFWVASKV